MMSPKISDPSNCAGPTKKEERPREEQVLGLENQEICFGHVKLGCLLDL